MKPFSLNRRLIVIVVASQLMLGAALALVGTSFSRHYIRSAFDVFLEGRAQSIAALVYFRDDGVPGLLFNDAKVPPSSHHVHKDLFLVKSDQHGFERYSPDYDPRIFDAVPAGAHFWKFYYKGAPYRAIILRNIAILDTEEGEPLPLPRLTVIYAAPTMDIDQEISRLGTAIGLVSLLILAPTLLVAIWSIRRALTPLNHLAASASAVSVNSWKFEPSDQARSTRELMPLIGAMQKVLVELEAAFTHEREFLGDATHELKTSLAILKSTVQELLNKPRRREEYEDGLGRIHADCLRLERLLNRMLQAARAEQRIASGDSRILEPVEVAATCEEAIARLAQFAAERGVAIEFFPECETAVRAEPADLELIWLNLLENAVQYSPSGSAVAVRVDCSGGSVQVAIVDRGCGIDAAHLPHIFKRFHRADSSRSRATGGFGLGLAIAKSLVDFYHGRIYAESELGRGTRVVVELPADESALVADREAGQAAANTASSQ